MLLLNAGKKGRSITYNDAGYCKAGEAYYISMSGLTEGK
jgi:hypothetical protein